MLPWHILHSGHKLSDLSHGGAHPSLHTFPHRQGDSSIYDRFTMKHHQLSQHPPLGNRSPWGMHAESIKTPWEVL